MTFCPDPSPRPLRVLFVLLWRSAPAYGQRTWGSSQLDGELGKAEPLSHGLSNSCRFVVEMLEDEGIAAELVHVASDNDVWKAIEAYKPTHVVLEAFWCRPKKFDDLRPLFPDVKFIVRGHSSTPFLAHDTYGFRWALDYLSKPSVAVAPNDPRHLAELRFLAGQATADVDARVPYLPNFYPDRGAPGPRDAPRRSVIDIGCFGAARPFKNMVGQAIAALMFAGTLGRRLRFHINGDRIECGGGPTVKNLEAIFAAEAGGELVRHDWMPHGEFLQLVASMDVVMQVSFAETFCIVAADAASQDVPVVGSAEIPWLPEALVADPTSPADMVRKLGVAWGRRTSGDSAAEARRALRRYCEETRRAWLSYLEI